MITIIIMVYVYQFKKHIMGNVENVGIENVKRAMIRGGALVDDIGHDRDNNHLYPIEILRRATNVFSDNNILGQSCSWIVYKGVPPSLLRGWTLKSLMRGR